MAETKTMSIEEIESAVQTNPLLSVPVSDWRATLASEVQVYVLGEQYLAKRFDQINYKFVAREEAKEVVIDNLYALLRTKYFTKPTEETDQRIQQIVQNFTLNLKTTLKKVSLKPDPDCTQIHWLPNSCIAFRNGVFDFKANKWLFKYDVIKMDRINNKVYLYDPKWLITWYMDFDFEPLKFAISKYSLETFIEAMKVMTKQKENYCFELVYNMSHDDNDKFSINKFKYICQTIGYMIYPNFHESFVVLVGGGNNGKNSLFDGCLTAHVVPTPVNNPMDDFENDRFITGSLVNHAQNIYLETTPKTMQVSRGLKNITGSMYQTIELKGVSKFSSIVNCKYLFSANDQDKLKFSDNSPGFRRRIQILEIFYEWDDQGMYLKKGDYYATNFSQDLHEIKNDISNAIVFCYLGMYGLSLGTNNFSEDFRFSYNDWNNTYTDVDLDIKDALETLTIAKVSEWLKLQQGGETAMTFMYDRSGSKLYLSQVFLANGGKKSLQSLIEMLDDEEAATSFFAENNVWISLQGLQLLLGIIKTPTAFTQTIKKIYGLASKDIRRFNANKPYVEVRITNGRLKIVKS